MATLPRPALFSVVIRADGAQNSAANCVTATDLGTCTGKMKSQLPISVGNDSELTKKPNDSDKWWPIGATAKRLH
jgi:hypothetical protein